MEIGKALMVSDILIVLAAAVRFGMGTGLYAQGVKSYPQSAIKTVSGNVATLTLDSGVEMNIKCDAIVNGADMLPNTSLVDAIDCKEVYTIGDCANPFNIALAIRGGNNAGRAV